MIYALISLPETKTRSIYNGRDPAYVTQMFEILAGVSDRAILLIANRSDQIDRLRRVVGFSARVAASGRWCNA